MAIIHKQVNFQQLEELVTTTEHAGRLSGTTVSNYKYSYIVC